jgi:hypothetical protein
MTKTEIELIYAIIDRHTENYETGHCGPTSKRINEVDKLKNDIRDTFSRINKEESSTYSKLIPSSLGE